MAGATDPSRLDLPARAAWLAKRVAIKAFAVGLVVAAVTSAGLVGERLSTGSLGAMLYSTLGGFGVALLALALTARPLNTVLAERAPDGAFGRLFRLRSSAVIAPQTLGAVCGIALVHALLQISGIRALTWMCERPAQFVNDGVAVGGTLMAIWACAAPKPRIWLLSVALVGLLCYTATRHCWHLDHAPVVFYRSIQELVVVHVVAAASGLLAFRRFGEA